MFYLLLEINVAYGHLLSLIRSAKPVGIISLLIKAKYSVTINYKINVGDVGLNNKL